MKVTPSSGAVKFSSALLSTDLNDFLSPGNSCVLPLNGGVSTPTPPPAPPGSVAAPMYAGSGNGDNASKAPVAKVTLSDCLSCSGCLTSAETVLLETQSADLLDAVLVTEATARPFVVVSLSQQSIASLASMPEIAGVGATLSATAGRVATVLRGLGVDAVLDLAVARGVALEASAAEFAERWKAKERLPMLASACPGFVCYAEKSQPAVLPHIAESKSPQAVMGAVVKRLLPTTQAWAHAFGRPRKIFHCTVMPCFDKKLEAARPEHRLHDDEPEVDAVLTTSELWEWLVSKDIQSLCATLPSGLDSVTLGATRQVGVFGGTETGPLVGSSGGYMHMILHKLLVDNSETKLRGASIEYKALKNSDFRKAVLVVDGTEVETSDVGLPRFAVANGFRNIQNLSRRIKLKKCEFDYVEVMSCPSGCNNGGGQVGIDASNTIATRERLGRTTAKYDQAYDTPSELCTKEARTILVGLQDKMGNEGLLTRYHELGENVASALQW